jgi:ferrochelatase
VNVAAAWHEEPAFIAALAHRLTDGLNGLPPDERESVSVLMTAHSLPRRVAEREPGYLAQLRATAEAVAAAAGLSQRQWSFCWQSAGHEPGEWMKPDFADLMPQVAASGGRSVLVVPVQFLADHLEILYDVDVGAREQAEQCGLAFHRIASLNVDPGLIDALGAVARRTLSPG